MLHYDRSQFSVFVTKQWFNIYIKPALSPQVYIKKKKKNHRILMMKHLQFCGFTGFSHDSLFSREGQFSNLSAIGTLI